MISGLANRSNLASGEGRGVIAQDGCAVEVYLKLPYRGELEVLAGQLPPRSSILERSEVAMERPGQRSDT